MEPTAQQRQAFIREELEWFDGYLMPELVKALKKRKIGVTEELLQSLAGKILDPGSGFDGGYELRFLTSGRFVDMGAGRGYSKGIASLQSRADKIYELTARKNLPKRKPKKWYSKTVYGIMDRLLMRLVSNYEEQLIKPILKSQTI